MFSAWNQNLFEPGGYFHAAGHANCEPCSSKEAASYFDFLKTEL
jgi:hypothetical protein